MVITTVCVTYSNAGVIEVNDDSNNSVVKCNESIYNNILLTIK